MTDIGGPILRQAWSPTEHQHGRLHLSRTRPYSAPCSLTRKLGTPGLETMTFELPRAKNLLSDLFFVAICRRGKFFPCNLCCIRQSLCRRQRRTDILGYQATRS